MPDQQIDAVADEIGRRLVAGIEQEDAVVQQLDLAQALARAPRVEGAGADEGREDLGFVAVLLAQPPADKVDEIVLELGDGGGAAGELFAAQHGLEGAEDRERPVAQPPALRLRHAEHVADELHRNGRGEIVDEVEAAARGVKAGASSLRTRV